MDASRGQRFAVNKVNAGAARSVKPSDSGVRCENAAAKEFAWQILTSRQIWCTAKIADIGRELLWPQQCTGRRKVDSKKSPPDNCSRVVQRGGGIFVPTMPA
jgi:hypothetical protein